MGISLRHTFGLPVALLSLLLLLSLTGCSPTKHVPQGEYLLDKVKIVTDSKEVKPETLKPYLRQEPNFRILGVARLQLAIYNLSGADTSKWINRWLRKIGTPPVIYDDNATQASCQQLSKALSNAGYMHAEVEGKPVVHPARQASAVELVLLHDGHALAGVSHEHTGGETAHTCADNNSVILFH